MSKICADCSKIFIPGKFTVFIYIREDITAFDIKNALRVIEVSKPLFFQIYFKDGNVSDFQGNRKWGIVGFSFISEQLVKCVGILFLIFDTKIGVVGAILGVTIAESLTAICMLILYFRQRESRFSLSLPSKSFIVYCISVSIGLIAMP